jgi:hypothetical protein
MGQVLTPHRGSDGREVVALEGFGEGFGHSVAFDLSEARVERERQDDVSNRLK